MRTTLDIDDDMLSTAGEFAHHDKETVGQVLSELARRALLTSETGAVTLPDGEVLNADEVDRRFRAMGFCPFPGPGKLVTNDMINALREQEGI